LNGTGTIKSISGAGAFIGTINANVTGSIKMGVVDRAVAAPATSIMLLSATDAPRADAPALKVSLTGVSLNGLFTESSSAAAVSIKIAAKKIRGAAVPAGVTAGAQIVAGSGLSLGVTGGNMYADLIESRGGIQSLTVKNGYLGQAPATSATLGNLLTPAALAVLQHPSTPVVVSGLHTGSALATDGIGAIGASIVHGVFVAGASSADGLIAPRCDAAVQSWKGILASGDAFVSEMAETQPAGIQEHLAAP
jgi:hypothetical protein